MTTGYGRDTWCLDSLQPGRMVSGRALVAQALFRRWTTPRGTLSGGPEEDIYGIDVVGFVGAAALPVVLGALPGMMRAEALKDDRVSDCRVTITSATEADGTVMVYPKAVVTLAGESESFELTLAVSATSAQVLGGLPT